MSNIRNATGVVIVCCLALSAQGAVVSPGAAQTTPYTVSSSDLLQTSLAGLPTSVGNFAQESAGGVVVLNDGSFGILSNSPVNNSGAATAGPGGGTQLTYTLNTSANQAGYTLNRIDTFTGWGDIGRNDQSYTVAYSTVAAPATFVDIATVNYPSGVGVPSATMVNLTDNIAAPLASQVQAIRFTFNAVENNYTGYRELDVFGVPTAVWTGATNSDWGTGSNWNPAAVPSAAGAAVVFGSAGARAAVDLGSADRTAGSLTFQSAVNTTIASGAQTLILDNTPSASPAYIGAAGAQAINARLSLNSALSANVIGAGDSLTLGGVIADGVNGAQGLTKVGAGTLNLTGLNTYGGTTIFAGGIVNVATLSNYGADGSLGNRAADSGAGNVGLLFRGGTLQYTGSTPQSTDRAIRVSTTGGAIIDASGSSPGATLSFTRTTGSPDFFENPGDRSLTFTGTNTGDNLFAMPITQTGGSTSVTKNGSGTWVLSGANAYSGATTINAGTLKGGAANVLGGGGSTSALVMGGGTLDLGGYNQAVGSASGTGTITSSAAGAITLTVGNDNTSPAAFAGVIQNGSATVGLTKVGSGTLSLTGLNSYGGTTVFAGGIVNVATLSNYGADGSLGNRAADSGAGNVGLLFRGGTLQYTGSTPQSTDRAIRVSTVGGAIIDASGSSPSATLSFTRTTASPDFFETGGDRSLTFTGTNTGDNLFAMPITQTGGLTSVNKNGSGTWVLSGVSTYTGATMLNAGTLKLAGGQNRIMSSPVTVGPGATLTCQDYAQTLNAVLTLNGGTVSGTGDAAWGSWIFRKQVHVTADSTLSAVRMTAANSLSGGFAVDSGATLNVTGTIADTGETSTVYKTGAGTLTLSGVNTYSGATIIDGGTLKLVGGSQTIGTASYATANTYAFAPASGNLLAGLSPTANSNGSGGLESTGPVTKLTDGAIVADNANTYYVGNGTGLTYTLGNAGYAITKINIYSGWNDSGRENISLNNISYSTVANPTTFTAISGSSVNYEGGTSIELATLTASGGILAPNVYAIRFNFGTQENSAVGYRELEVVGAHVGALPAATAVQIAGGSTLDLNGTTQTIASLADYGGSGGSVINSAVTGPLALVINPSSGSTTFSGTISDSGAANAISLVKCGAGTQVLSGANTYSGATIVNAGTLKGGAANVLGGANSTSALVMGGGTLDLGGYNQAVGSVSGAGTITSSAAGTITLTVGNDNTSPAAFAGVIQDGSATVGLTKVGSGTLSLTGANTYSGATVIAGGTLKLVGGSQTIGTASYTTANTYAFAPAGGNLLAGLSPTANSNGNGGQSGTGPVTKLTDGAIVADTANTYYIGNGAGLTYTLGNAGYNITKINIYSGWNDSGRENISLSNISYSTVADPTTFTAIPGSSVNYEGGTSIEIASLTASGGILAPNVYAIQFNFGTQENNIVGYRELEVVGTPVGGLPATTALQIAGGSTLDLNGTRQTIASLADYGGNGGTVENSNVLPVILTINPAGGSTTFSGVIRDGSGALSLVKSGAGTQILAGINTYSGGTTINAGTLLVSNSTGSGTGSGPVVVNSGATLGGLGRIAGPVTVNGTGQVSPGASIGRLTLDSGYTMLGGTLDIELNGTAGAGLSGGNDVLGVYGPINLSGGSLALLLNCNPGEGNRFLILDNLGSGLVVSPFPALAEGAWLSENYGGRDYRFQISYVGGTGNDVVLTSEVPEPATMALLGLAAAGLGGYIRRRRAA